MNVARTRLCAHGLIALPERVVMDCQALSRIGGSTTSSWPTVEKTIVRNMDRFSPHQLALCLSAVARGGYQSRKLVHSISLQLGKSQDELSLKDLALVVNAFSKMGIKNEVFLTCAIPAIIRKVKYNQHVFVSPAVLILDGYSKLGFLGDGTLVHVILDRISELISEEGRVNPIDAVTVLRSLSRMDPASIPSMDAIITRLLGVVSSGDPVLAVSALSALGKLASIVQMSPGVTAEIRRLEQIATSNLRTLTHFKLVQLMHALSVLHPTGDAVMGCFTEAVRVRGSQIFESSHESLVILLMAAVNRMVERIWTEDILTLMSVIPVDSLSPVGFAVFVNLRSTVNLQLDDSHRGLILNTLDKPLDAHTVAVLINSLSKLDEFELVTELIGWIPPSRELVNSMTPQAIQTCLLAVSMWLDVVRLGPHSPTVETAYRQWLAELVKANGIRGKSQASPESLTQLRIVDVLNGACVSGESHSTTSPRPPSVVSPFHRQVIDAISSINTEPQTLTVNAVEPVSGYEIDILV